jgi:Zn-dependent peptidase ImmA (M78 family)/DNA-binding XRE family transcriptional regulator
VSEHARAAALFDADRLTLAREAAGLTKAALAQSAGVTPAAISQYENEVNRPSAATVGKLAWSLGVAPGFFESQARAVSMPSSEDAFFRSLRATTRQQRRQASARAALFAELAFILEEKIELPPLTVRCAGIDCDSSPEAIIALAARVRDELGLGEGPVGHLVRVLEANGVLVTRFPADDGRVSAFSQWFAGRPVVVLQNKDVARLRYDLAHELGHIAMHDEPDAGNAVLERQANLFAAHFLMPAHQLAPVLPHRFDLPALLALKRTWGVSVAALLYHARELGCMTDAAYRNAVIKMSATYGRRNEPHPSPTPNGRSCSGEPPSSPTARTPPP